MNSLKLNNKKLFESNNFSGRVLIQPPKTNLIRWYKAKDLLNPSTNLFTWLDSISGNNLSGNYGTGTGIQLLNGNKILNTNNGACTSLSNISLNLNSTLTIISVAESLNVTFGHCHTIDKDANNVQNFIVRPNRFDINLVSLTGFRLSVAQALPANYLSTPKIFAVTIVYTNPPSAILYINGTKFNYAGTPGFGAFAGNYKINKQPYAAAYLIGEIGEILHYDATLSNADINKAGKYFENLYGIAWTNI